MPEKDFVLRLGCDFAHGEDRTVVTLFSGTQVLSTMEFRRGEIQNGHIVRRPEVVHA